jgi:hypothetical protein
MSTAPLGSLTGAAAEPPADRPLADAPWSLEPGATIQPYEQPSRFEKGVLRTLNNPHRTTMHSTPPFSPHRRRLA